MPGEFRYMSQPRPVKLDGRIRIFHVVVEEAGLFELAPWFESAITAHELAYKVSRGDQFCDRIPCVAKGTTIPRPAGTSFVPNKAKGITSLVTQAKATQQ